VAGYLLVICYDLNDEKGLLFLWIIDAFSISEFIADDRVIPDYGGIKSRQIWQLFFVKSQ